MPLPLPSVTPLPYLSPPSLPLLPGSPVEAVWVCVCPGVGVSGRGKSSISETDKGQTVVPWALSTH